MVPTIYKNIEALDIKAEIKAIIDRVTTMCQANDELYIKGMRDSQEWLAIAKLCDSMIVNLSKAESNAMALHGHLNSNLNKEF